MNQEQRSLLLNSFPSHPEGGKVCYGPRGFSGDASLLLPTAYKAGILAALRSFKSQSVIGLMITASGDVEGSPGVRIIDPDGRMLTSHWKPFADSMANVGDPDQFVALIERIAIEESISFECGQPAEIWLGRTATTPPTGESLFHAAKQGTSSIMGAVVHDMGVLTAPQLHWLIRSKNEGLKSTEHEYFEQLSLSYRCLADLVPCKATAENNPQKLVVYGASGVGGAKLEVLKDLCDGLEMDIRSSGEDNCSASDQAGINFIEKTKIFASGFGSGDVELRFASFDADAERLVYLVTRPSHNEIDIVHADKVSSLFALFIREQLNILDDDEKQQTDNHCYSRLGIVHSASVGEASADFFKSLGFSFVLLSDGVECLHEEAAKYDIGIYTTEDGHSTILFSGRFLSWLESINKDLPSTPEGSRRQKAANQLLAVSKLMNHATSDALGGLLLVETILRHMGWSVQQWNDLSKMELDVVADEDNGMHGRAVTYLDGLSRCQEAIDSEHGIENGTRTLPIEDTHEEPAKCQPWTVEDSEVLPKESNVVDLTVHSVESQIAESPQNEIENQCSKEFSADSKEKVDSVSVDVEADETAQSDNIDIHSVSGIEELVDERKSHLETKHPTGQEPETRVTVNTFPAQMEEENVILKKDPSDENVIESRGAANDVTQMLETEVDGHALVVGSRDSDTFETSIKDNDLVAADNVSSPDLIDPSISEEPCLATEEGKVVNGDESTADSDSTSVATASKSIDSSHDSSVSETHGDGAKDLDGSLYTNHTAHGDDEKSEETGSINGSADASNTEPKPAENGHSVVNFSCDADVKSETEPYNDDEDIGRKLNGAVDGNGSKNGDSKVNFSHDGDCVSEKETKGNNDNAYVNRELNGEVDDNSSDMNNGVSSREVNGVKELVNGTKTLPVLSDVNETQESGVVDVDLNHKSEVDYVSSVDPSAIHNHMENGAECGQVDAGKQFNCVAGDPGLETNLSTSEVSEVSVPICNGEGLHSLSEAADTPGMESKIILSTSDDSEVIPLCNGEDPHSPVQVAETPGEKSKDTPSTSDLREVSASPSNGEDPHYTSEVDRTEGLDNGVVCKSYEPLSKTEISVSTSEVDDAIAPSCNGEECHSPEIADNCGTETGLSTSEVNEVNAPLCNGEDLHSPVVEEKIEGPDNDAGVMSSQLVMNGAHSDNINGVISGIECENGPLHIETKSITTIANLEGLVDSSVKEAGKILEIEAENGPFNTNELGSPHGLDDKKSKSQLNIMSEPVSPVHDATSGSVADDAEVVGLDGKSKDQLDDITSGISFGSFTSGNLSGNLSIQVTDGTNEGNGCIGDGGDELSESKAVEATSVGPMNSPQDDASSFESAERGHVNNDGKASSELVLTNGAHAEVSTSSHKVSATDTRDGEIGGTEDVKLPFYYLIKIPRYEDSELINQKKLAEVELEEKTRKRDAIQSECRKAQELWSELKQSVDAAIQEERDVRDQIRAKRKQIDSAQALVDIAKDAMTIEDLDRKVADMEHKIQHETMPLKEEKDIIREIKQSKQLREQLLSVSSKKQGVQQALDDRDKNKEHSKVLRKEIDVLREKLFKLEQATKAARTKFDEETKKLNYLRDERSSANAIRNDAFSNLILRKKQWAEKAKYFYQYKENQTKAYQYVKSGDKELLQQHCVNQVETIMTMWNTNDEFRKDYVRCSRVRILRSFGTLDGRALGPNEEPAPLRVVERGIVNASVKELQVSKDAKAEAPLISKAKETDNRSLEKVVVQKNPDNQSSEKVVERRNAKNIIVKIADRSIPEKVDVVETVEMVEEDQEVLKLRQKEEEAARRAEELRKEEEAVKLKERLRQEEKEKAQQALERKRRQAEKAQAKAEAKAKKEAELKEKEREKKARKKEKKTGNAETSATPETEAATVTEEVPNVATKEPEIKERRSIASTKRPARTQYTKQNKIIKSIAPPPAPLRNRGKRRMPQWMWILVAVAAVIGLFFLGNGNFALVRELFDSFN